MARKRKRRNSSPEVTQQKLDTLNDGAVFKNAHIYAFTLLGKQYSTNKRRYKAYSMDDKGWRISDKGLAWRIYMVLTKKVRKLHQ